MTDYNKSKIYQIKNVLNDDIYVGSTTEALATRMTKHRYEAKRNQCTLHKTMRELGTKAFFIELIEEYPCANKQELNAREGHFIKQRGTLNDKVAGRSPSEYYNDVRPQKLAYAAQYRASHDRKAYDAEYREAHREKKKEQANVKVECDICGKCILKYNLPRHNRTQHRVFNRHDLLLVPAVEGRDG